MSTPKLKLLTLAFFVVGLLLVGVAVGVLIMPGLPRVSAMHDDTRGVTCWIASRGGVSCFPDWILAGPQR